MQDENSLIQLVQIPQIIDDCFLYFAQRSDHIPFLIKRVYYILQAHPRKKRGFHAHKKTQQIIFCLQGSIKLILDNGKIKSEVLLDKPNVGVIIDKMIWHEMHDFKKNTILLILASKKFNPADYIRNYEQFKKAIKVS